VRRAQRFRFGVGHQAKFRRVGLAEDDGSRGFETAHHLAVVRHGHVLHQASAAAGRHTSIGGQQVLQQERHAPERAIGQVTFGSHARLLVHFVDYGVELGIVRFDAADRFFNQIGGRHLAGAHEFSQPQPIELVEFRKSGHACLLLWSGYLDSTPTPKERKIQALELSTD
jgi:hypothetical protein